ncbi:ANTAR domain-containing protein [Streptomyces sp. NPDC002701]|uniref:ANTAR domain-containing protein n=1 Tax=Streptomyces sp. NPDC002701 TaxID=3364661 RepID=UPI0036CE97FD
MTADAMSAAGLPAEPPAEGQLDALIEENEQLQQAVHSHAVVDQAIGVLIAVGRLTPEQGWHVLRTVSQHTNVKLRTVAEHIVTWARTQKLPDTISTQLQQQLESAHLLHIKE